jgi:hypothetical protein
MHKNLQRLLAAGAIASLAACGGGDSAPAAAVAPAMSGTAAVGFPIVGGTVSVKCAGGSAITPVTTSSAGAWNVSVSGQTLPCAVQVSGGTINSVANTLTYQSIGTAAGTVNITPLTTLLMANLAGTATPASWFSALTSGQIAAINSTLVNTALANLKTALGLSQLNGINPVTLAFNATPGVVMDDILAALATAQTNAGVTFAQIVAAAGTGAGSSFSAPAGLGTALTTAYAGTTSGSGGGGGGGGAVTTCASSHYSVPVHAPSVAELATYAKTYTGDKGAFGPNIGDPFVSTGGINFVLNSAGLLTYNGGTKLVTSMCLEDTPTQGAPLYVEFQPADGIDLFTDGGFTGFVGSDIVQGGSCTTTCGGTSGGSGSGGTTPVAVGTQMGGARQGVVPTLATNVHPYAALYASAPATYPQLAQFASLTQYSTLTTLAGSGTTNVSTDGTGLAATFQFLTGTTNRIGITTDGLNLYVTEPTRIRKIVIATGEVTTLAGSGALGFVDGTGAAASFTAPQAMTTDGTNLYVADTGNSAIRKVVIATGVVTTLAGSTPFYFPDSITTDGTNLYVGDKVGTYIRKIVIATGAASILTGTGLTSGPVNGIKEMTTDGTYLYVVESAISNVLKKVLIATGAVTTIATKGSSDPLGYGALTTDGTYLYVSSGTSIRQITIATGVTVDREIKDTATNEPQRLYGVHGITTDGKSLFLVDSYGNAPVNGTVRKLGS